MKPLTIVVSFDVGEQVVPGGIPGWVASQVHEFGFQSAEATLSLFRNSLNKRSLLASLSNRIRRFFGVVDGFSCKLIALPWRDSLCLGEEAEGDSMRPKERQDSGQHDLFKARLDQIVDLSVRLERC
jgi:hypothetical protein